MVHPVHSVFGDERSRFERRPEHNVTAEATPAAGSEEPIGLKFSHSFGRFYKSQPAPLASGSWTRREGNRRCLFKNRTRYLCTASAELFRVTIRSISHAEEE